MQREDADKLPNTQSRDLLRPEPFASWSDNLFSSTGGSLNFPVEKPTKFGYLSYLYT